MNKHIRRYAFALLICIVVLLSACGNANNTNVASTAERNLTDDFGHQVKFKANPERILAPYMEDSLVTLGVTPVAKYSAGGTVQEHLESWLVDLPTIDLMSGISPEVALSFKPDLIMISSHFLPVEMYDTISKVAPTYLFGGADWRDQLYKVAEILGKENLAEQKLSEYDAKIAETKGQLSKVWGEKTIAIVWPSEKEIFLVGSDFLSGKLLYGELGLKSHELSNVTPDNFSALSLEKIADLDADELFVITPEGQTDEEVQELLNRLPLWEMLPAVKNNRVHHVSSGHWINSAYLANLAVLKDVTEALLP